MTSLLRTNSFLFGSKRRDQRQQEANPRPKSPFSEINLFSWKQGSVTRNKDPYVRPSTADGMLNSFTRRPSQGIDSIIDNGRRPSHTASMLCLAPPVLLEDEEESKTVYIGLQRDSSYHKPLPSTRLPADARIQTAVPRQRKDSVVSPQSGKTSLQTTPIRGNSPIRPRQQTPPLSITVKPKLNRWKSLGGFLGRRPNRSITVQTTRTQSMMGLASNGPARSQSMTPASQLQASSHQATREDPLRSNPINASLLNLTQKSKTKVLQSSPLKVQHPQSPQLTFYEPSLFSPISPLQMTPFIDIDIPDAKMERYSIMFEGVNVFRKPSLLDRRRSTKEKLASLKPLSVPKPVSRPKTPTGRRRRSSSASSARTTVLSLFPSGHLSNNNSAASLHARTPSGNNLAFTPSHRRTSSGNDPYSRNGSSHRRTSSGGSRPSPPRRTRTAPVDVLPPLVSPSLETVAAQKVGEPQLVRPKTSDSQASSVPNLSPLTPPPMLDVDPAASFLANRKAAPWEHRRMHRQPSWSTVRNHNRSDSQESDTWSIECAQVIQPQPRHTSTIIEEAEDIEDWHHTGEVQLARSLSLTRPDSAIIKPAIKSVKRTAVQLEQNSHRRVKSQVSMPNLPMVKDSNVYQQGHSAVLECS